MQLLPSTAADMGVHNIADPAQNIEGGAKYLAKMRDKYRGNMDAALAAYNWGPGNLDKYGMNKAPEETRKYLAEVMGRVNTDVPMLDVPPSTNIPAEPRPQQGGDSTIAQDIARGAMGFNRGFFHDIPDAASQVMGAILPDRLQRALDVENMTIQEHLNQKNQAYEQQRQELGGQGIDLGRLAGNMINPVSIATGATGEAAVVPAWFAKLAPSAQEAMSAMFRGGVGAAVQPVDNLQPGQSLGNAKAQQVGIGAAAGGAAQGAASLLGTAAGKVMGTIRNDMPPDVAAIQQIANKAGVNLTAGDIRPENKAFTGIEGRLENLRIPFASMSPIRKAQQLQAQAEAQRLVDDQFQKLNNMSYQSMHAIQAAASSDGPRQAEAKKILDMVANAGPDEKAIMQASGNLTWLRKKLSSDKLYAARDAIAGDNPVDPAGTIGQIDNIITKATSDVHVDRGFVNKLQGWRQQLVNPTSHVVSAEDPIETAVREAAGEAAPQGAPVINTFARMDTFRSKIQKDIADASENGVLDPTARYLKGIVKAVDGDMSNTADTIPGLTQASARARKFYDDHVVPYQTKTLAKALTSDTPENIYGAFVRQQAQGKGDYAAKKFWAALDEKGRQAVRYGIVKDAMTDATSSGSFSPAKFSDFVKGTEYGQYFKGPELQRVEAINTLFSHLRNASPEHLQSYSPTFGSILGVGAGGAAALLHPVGAAVTAGAGLGGFKLMRWLMTSDTGKRLLLANNPILKGGSQENIGKVLEKIGRAFSAEAGSFSGAQMGNRDSVQPQEGQ